MNEYLSKCSWKMIDPDEFIMGINAERCGKVAVIRIIRPSRKTDLFLCEQHINKFIDTWGLHNNIEILCDPEDKYRDKVVHPLFHPNKRWEINP